MTPPETSAAPLTIHLFGPMRVLTHGSLIPRLRSRKTLWLLALLTLRHGRPIEREWIAGTLWPDATQSQAFAGLRPLLTELRQTLQAESARLQSPSRHTLILDLNGADVDLLTFDAAMASEDLSAMGRAIDLYRGPLLEGCAEEWAHPERADRETRLLHALRLLSQNALVSGDPRAAAEYLRRAVAIDPWRDTAQREWMEALVQAGDSNAALLVYRNFVDLLRSDPLAAPDAQISDLYSRLRKDGRLRRDPAAAEKPAKQAPASQTVGYLPVPLTDLIGRDAERRELSADLGRSRLVTITGPGGVGKTRLAIEVASEVAPRFPDGVWMAALEAVTDANVTAARIASLLGVREEPGRSALDSIADYLRRKELLLVLDNCEHLLDSCARIAAHLLRECTGLRILATSREVLGVVGETAWATPSLSIASTDDLAAAHDVLPQILSQYDSAQLFVERARAAKRTFALSPGNAHSVAQICRRTEGIPLAIELAAARIPSMTPKQIEERLSDYLGLLTVGSRTSPSRQQTLRGTLDWSYALLDDRERSLLGRISVFAGGWSLEAAQRVSSEELSTDLTILDLLNSLIGKSLVVFEEEGRYRLLEMVRQYAAERLRASGDEEDARTKHRDYFLDLAEESETQLQGANQEIWLRLLDKEHENLRAALSWSETKSQDPEIGLRMAGALWQYWYLRGDYEEARKSLSAALEQDASQPPTAARAKALNSAASVFYYQGDHDAARERFASALQIFPAQGKTREAAESLCGLANLAIVKTDYALAQTLYEESLTIWRTAEDEFGVTKSLMGLGYVFYTMRDLDAAQGYFDKALTIRRKIGNRRSIAETLTNCANIEYVRGEYEASRTLYAECLATYQDLRHRRGAADALGSLGNVEYAQNNLTRARTFYEESLRLRRELGERRGIGTLLSRLADVALADGDGASAIRLHRESLRIHREVDEWRGMAQNLVGVAQVMLTQSQARDAAKILGAVHELLNGRSPALVAYEKAANDRQRQQTRQALGPDVYDAAWEEGRLLTWEQAAALGLED